jgi:hypothetical protein
MKTTPTMPALQSDPDGDAVIESIMTGRPLDPEIARRIEERADKITDELRRKYGTLNVAVDLVREVRDEE